MQSGDADLFWPLTQVAGMWTWFTADLSKRDVLDRWVQDAMSAQQAGTRIPFTVVDATTGQVLGSTSFGNISTRDQRVEIGWTWLGKPAQGKGVNDRMKILMLDHAFNTWNMQRVEWKTDVLNPHSRNALLRIGAVEEGILRSHMLMTHGRRRDTIYYGMLRDEYLKRKA